MSILGESYYQTLDKNMPELDPVLVIRGVHAIAQGILEHKVPARADADFTSGAYHFFSAHGEDMGHYNTRNNTRRRAEMSRRGWLLLLAEDMLDLVGIVDHCRKPKGKIHMVRPQERQHAHELLLAADDKDGVFVNASQAALSDRLRGVGGLAGSVHWLGRTLFSTEGVSIQAQRAYTPAALGTLTTQPKAMQAFLSNIFAHESYRITGDLDNAIQQIVQ